MWKKLLGVGGISLCGLTAAFCIPNNSGFVSFPANLPIEDRYVISNLPTFRLAAVFDGHGGWQVSEYLHRHIQGKIESISKKGTIGWDSVLCQAFDELESEIFQSVIPSYRIGFANVATVGACAIVAVVLDGQFIVANAGDCQAVLVSDKQGVITGENICEVHSSNLKAEQDRLAKEHPGEEDIVVCRSTTACYVKSRLMPTRAFGDFHLKHEEFNNPERLSPSFGFHRSRIEKFTGPYITHKPDVKIRNLETGDKFLILASDGLWDEMTPQQAAEIAGKVNDPQEAAKLLLEAALEHAASEQKMQVQSMLAIPVGIKRRSLHDDITVVVVPLS